jgi:hypothetical protein
MGRRRELYARGWPKSTFALRRSDWWTSTNGIAPLRFPWLAGSERWLVGITWKVRPGSGDPRSSRARSGGRGGEKSTLHMRSGARGVHAGRGLKREHAREVES